MLHRFSTFTAGCTILLILAGSLVTSHDAGLSVPDWPTSYGWNMFTFPPSMWVANIFYEHGHRLIATSVGFLTIILAIWLWRVEPRRWLRWLGVASLVAVVAQGLLGGLTVLYFLPAAISTAHAALAEIFFCLTVAIALFTSPGWIAGYDPARPSASAEASADRRSAEREGWSTGSGRASSFARGEPFDSLALSPSKGELAQDRLVEPRAASAGVDDPRLRRIATTTTVLIYTQILIGATMRHTGAGLAIPDFPLMFGGIVPDHWSAKIAIHFAHRVGALIVTIAVAALFAYARAHYRDRRELMRPARLILALVAVQITLGALTVLSLRDPWINSSHVVCGALVLTTSLVIALRTWRGVIEDLGMRNADSAESAIESAIDNPIRNPQSAIRNTPARGRA